MARAAAVFSKKLLVWSLMILLDSNINVAKSSSVSSLCQNQNSYHRNNRNFDLAGKPKNKRQSSTNLTQDEFQENFPSNEEIEFKHTGQEVINDNERNDCDKVQQFVIGQSLNSTKRCIQYSEKYLYQLLEHSGMLNQWFMANSPEQAGHSFVRSYKYFFRTEFDHFDLPQDDSLRSDIQDISISFTCNDLCQSIIWKLNEALAKEKNDTFLLNTPYLDDAQSRATNDNSAKSTLTNCQLGMFIPIAKCNQQGTEEFENHNKLCTSCQGIYMLDKMCFPRFINAIRCESEMQTSGCIFDKISLQAHGSCYMRTLTFKILRNTGSEECQEWRYEYIQVPTSCECQLDMESLLLSAVKL